MRLNETSILARARGSVLSDGFGVWAARSRCAPAHASLGVTVLVALDHAAVVQLAGARRLVGRALVVPARCVHAVEAPGPCLTFSYEPELSASRAHDPLALTGRVEAQVRSVVHAQRASLHDPDVLAQLAVSLASHLQESVAPRRLDWRVARARELLAQGERCGTLRGRTRISPSHLQALFARELGCSMRTYRLWRRLRRALGACAALDFTHASHHAGFTDLAHFSRTCRKMVGHSPTELRRESLR